MLTANKEKIQKISKCSDSPLMKPFALGWTREVVKRVITKNKNLNCDIYYFSPSGKKIRSLTEVKSNLTDGLTPECFSFKKEPLGVHENYETIRDARIKRKINESPNDVSNKEVHGAPASDFKNSAVNNKRKRCTNSYSVDNLSKSKVQENVETKISKKNEVQKEEKKGRIARKRIGKKDLSYSFDKKIKSNKMPVDQHRKSKCHSQGKMKRRKTSKQDKITSGRKILKKIISKKVKGSQKSVASGSKTDKGSSNMKTKVGFSCKKIGKSVKQNDNNNHSSNQTTTEMQIDDTDQKTPKDLKSIVKRNIGKYREMRERQKLTLKPQTRGSKSKIVIRNIPRTRSEPIKTNKQLYMKPLEKGWRRELVFRTNSSKMGQHADVYYFHPSGKKLRSCREIAKNLTQGLTIEYFTFRKEPIGCGEPSEIIRQARSLIK